MLFGQLELIARPNQSFYQQKDVVTGIVIHIAVSTAFTTSARVRNFIFLLKIRGKSVWKNEYRNMNIFDIHMAEFSKREWQNSRCQKALMKPFSMLKPEFPKFRIPQKMFTKKWRLSQCIRPENQFKKKKFKIGQVSGVKTEISKKKSESKNFA